MEQTLHGSPSGGDRILAFKIVYDFRDPRQGEVVVFKGPDTWAPEADIPGPTSWFGQRRAGARLRHRHRTAQREGLRQTGDRGRRPDGQVLRREGQGEVDGVAGRALHLRAHRRRSPGRPAASLRRQSADPDRYDSERCFAPFNVPDGRLLGDGRPPQHVVRLLLLLPGSDPGRGEAVPGRAGRPCGLRRPIPVDDVIGKAVFIVMPPSRWGTVGSPDIDRPGRWTAVRRPGGAAVDGAGGHRDHRRARPVRGPREPPAPLRRRRRSTHRRSTRSHEHGPLHQHGALPGHAAPPDLRVEKELLRGGYAPARRDGRGRTGRTCRAGDGRGRGRHGMDRTGAAWPARFQAADPGGAGTLVPAVRRWVGEWAVGHASPGEIDGIGIIGRAADGRTPRAAAAARSGRRGAAGRQPRLSGRAAAHPVRRPADQDGLVAAGVQRRQHRRAAAPCSGGDRAHPDQGRPDLRGVAGASVLAKTERDGLLIADAGYPEYRFAINKGYGTPEHVAALRRHGPSEVHRRSWRLTGMRWRGMMKSPCWVRNDDAGRFGFDRARPRVLQEECSERALASEPSVLSRRAAARNERGPGRERGLPSEHGRHRDGRPLGTSGARS